MHLSATFLDLACAQGGALVAKVMSRDQVHLAPPALTRAAAKRLRQGLRAIEAYARRVLVLLALSLEPGLKPDQSARPVRPAARKTAPQIPALRIFGAERASAPFPHLSPKILLDITPGAKIIHAAPLLARLSHLQALLAAPERRARKLAFCMARRRPGSVLPPGLGGGLGREGVPRRYGTEVSSLYASLAHAILTAGRARPPPLGPRPRPPPRIRLL